MDGDVDAAREERLLDLFDEDAAFTNLAERARAIAVAGGGNRQERDLDSGRPHRGSRTRRLDERKLRAARADTNEHRSPSSSPRSGRSRDLLIQTKEVADCLDGVIRPSRCSLLQP